jgi:hypothetical protein
MLNTTICTGVTVSWALPGIPDLIYIGHGVARAAFASQRFPVRLGRRNPTSWLRVGYKVTPDESGRFLTIQASHFGVYSADDEASCLCRFDYERNKGGGYPEAHLQVYGKSAALASWAGEPKTRELARLHLPAGGRRFRFVLEDVIQFLVVEGLAQPRDGWEAALAAHRREWEDVQARAVTRQYPEAVRDVLRELENAGLLAG